MGKTAITQQQLMELLKYDAHSGVFIWLVDRGRKAKAGAVAGCIRPDGYRSIIICGRSYRAHRLAWLYVHGKWPVLDIDHLNGNGDDNRIANLRDVTTSVNCQNQRRATVKNVSGVLGVSFHKRTGKYQAKIKLDGKSIYLGLFATPELAGDAYLQAKRSLHPGCTI